MRAEECAFGKSECLTVMARIWIATSSNTKVGRLPAPFWPKRGRSNMTKNLVNLSLLIKGILAG